MENNIHEDHETNATHESGYPQKNNNFLAISILAAAILISASIVYLVKSGATSGVKKVPKTEFAACVTSRKYQSVIQNDIQQAQSAGITGTPATFVNGYFINGAQPWSAFKEAIDNAIAGKKMVSAAGSPTVPPVGDRDVILGEANAPVTVIEYGDYQCPFCARFFTDVEPLIRENYVKTGKVRMIFRNYAFLGAESIASAEAAECAKDEGQFWPFHDALYTAEHQDGQEQNGNLNNDLFFKIADQLKLK